MDIDPAPAEAAATPQSPPSSSLPDAQSPKPQSTPSFTVPVANGVHGSAKDDAPVPPPHKSSPASPVSTPVDEAEAYKAAGNKFFKDKEYKKAIEQYSKGRWSAPDIAVLHASDC